MIKFLYDSRHRRNIQGHPNSNRKEFDNLKRFISTIMLLVMLVSMVSINAYASTGQSFIIASAGSYDYGGGGYKDDTVDADVYISKTTNIFYGLRYVIKSGTSSSTTTVSGLTDRYDSYDFTISYKPAYQTTGYRYLWGYSLGSSQYTVESSGTFYP